jgi:hypothetical protein
LIAAIDAYDIGIDEPGNLRFSAKILIFPAGRFSVTGTSGATTGAGAER